MSRLLSEYGAQKSTSITTAKRLSEFLGDEMVKDKGLACNFIISRKPDGAPVTERAVPVAIFKTEDSVKKSYLRRWLKTGPGAQSFDLRDILDWEYYIERLGSAIQKIITIPAAMQKVANPVPRVRHPDWLHARLLEKADKFKQKSMTEMFGKRLGKGEAQAAIEAADSASRPAVVDIEDQFDASRGARQALGGTPRVTIGSRGGKVGARASKAAVQAELESHSGDWRTALAGEDRGSLKRDSATWLAFNRKKWAIQKAHRKRLRAMGITGSSTAAMRGADNGTVGPSAAAATTAPSGGVLGYFAKQAASMRRTHWEVIQIAETDEPGIMRVWAMINGDLHCMKLNCYRRFFVNLRTPDVTKAHKRVTRALPRAHPCMYMYEFNVKEREYLENQRQYSSYFTHPDVEGVYETQVPLLWRTVVEMGCVCAVNPKVAAARGGARNGFTLPDFDFKTTAECDYLESAGSTMLKRVYFHHSENNSIRQVFGIFFPETARAHVFVVDPGRNNAIGNAGRMWAEARAEATTMVDGDLGPEKYDVEVRAFNSGRAAGRPMQELLGKYIEDRHGPTLIVLQSPSRLSALGAMVPALHDFPVVSLPANARDSAYPALDWQRYAMRQMMRQHTYGPSFLEGQINSARCVSSYSCLSVFVFVAFTCLFIGFDITGSLRNRSIFRPVADVDRHSE